MRELRTEIEIDAPAERVWAALTDFKAFPDWNPFVRRIDGEPELGAKLAVRLDPPDGMGMSIKPTVGAVEPNRELRWQGRLMVPGLFDGEHRFAIEPLEGERVRFVHSERFTGVLVPLFTLMAEKSTRNGFEAMNRALKERAEASGTV